MGFVWSTSMPARAIWKATLELDKVTIPVKLYSAIHDSTVHFRLLHDRDKAPVKQELVESDDGNEVKSDSVEKGAPVAPGRFVVLTDDELAAVEPEESRTIEVIRFIPTAALDHAYYNRAYWLGPDGESARYWALVEALTEQKREGIARWVMRKRAYTGALRVRDDHLVLITLRHIGEVVEPKELDPPSARSANRKELDMARQLVSMLEGPFDPDEYRDEYRDRVLELIKRKARGAKIRPIRATVKRAPASLADALAKSIAAAGDETTPKRGTRKAAHG
jgi:DNA end-binding protein Ku